jgi:hypothetical protein
MIIADASPGSASFLEGLPILDIIRAGAAGLAVLVAILAYQITRDVVRGNADPIRAGLAKFSWIASLILVSMMVASELVRLLLPSPHPKLGIQTAGWNETDFAGPLKVRIWDPPAPPFDKELATDLLPYEIQSGAPMVTINLEKAVKRIQAQAATVSELAKSVSKPISAEHASKPVDVGPAPSP